MSIGRKAFKHYTLIGQTVVECGLWEWALMFQQSATRRVRLTRIGPFLVSTIFLGLDHNFSPSGPPLVFETMTFLDAPAEVSDFGGRNDYDGRWATWAEAERGHDAAVQFLRAEFCYGEEPEEVEDDPVPPEGVRCFRCDRTFQRGPYFERRIKRHLIERHKEE